MWDFFGNVLSTIGNFWNGERNRSSQEGMARANMDLQREFAQNGIKWKVQDALNAGIHPLVALGAQTSSFSPVSIGEGNTTSFDNMGQSLGRALKATMDTKDRQATEAAQLELENKRLENDLVRQQVKASKLAVENAQVGPPMPVAARVPMPTPGPARSAGGHAIGEDDLKQKPDDAPGHAVVRPWGYPIIPNPYFGDGQTFEDRYGDSEIGSTAKFFVNQVADHLYTGHRFLADREHAYANRFAANRAAYRSRFGRR